MEHLLLEHKLHVVAQKAFVESRSANARFDVWVVTHTSHLPSMAGRPTTAATSKTSGRSTYRPATRSASESVVDDKVDRHAADCAVQRGLLSVRQAHVRSLLFSFLILIAFYFSLQELLLMSRLAFKRKLLTRRRSVHTTTTSRTATPSKTPTTPTTKVVNNPMASPVRPFMASMAVAPPHLPQHTLHTTTSCPERMATEAPSPVREAERD
jgi:hypothetical protein